MQKKTLEILAGFAVLILLSGIISVYALGYFDSDGDGVIDNQDAFPHDPLKSKDSDKDGVDDKADAFPFDPAEWKDSDHDGVGDNTDMFPYNRNEWKDSDGDGVGDTADAFPFDPAASTDSDGDGYPDAWNEGWDPSNTKTCAISGLAYNTTYTWTVQVTDGYNWTSQTYTFTTQSAPANNPPIVTNPYPMNGSSEVPINTTSLSITIQTPNGGSFNWTITTSPNIGNNSGTGWTTNLTLDPSPNDPSDMFDSDGDGVLDLLDAFPYDPAASNDSDFDGYPDEWNQGWNQSTGTTTLTLDAFPNDPNKWRNQSVLPSGIVSDRTLQLSEISNARGITYDGSTYYYILSYNYETSFKYRVYQFNNDFSFTGVVWDYTGFADEPTGITCYNGHIYITANYKNSKGNYQAYLFKYSLTGVLEDSRDISSNIGYAKAITCVDDHIYICDSKSSFKSIHIYSASSLTHTKSISIGQYPSGIVVNEVGNWCFINDQSTGVNRLFLYDLNGNYKNWNTQFTKQNIELVGDTLLGLSGNKLIIYKLL